MPFVPFIKTPLSDIAGVLGTSQHYGKCQDLESRVINCLEAYGMERGLNKCSDLVADFKECFYKDKESARMSEMKAEQLRQLKEKKKNIQDVYLPEPRLDAFQ